MTVTASAPPRCLELGRAFARGNTLLACARPILEELSRTTGESAHIGVMQNYEVVHLDGEQSRQLVLAASRVGGRLPAHCTALGKVLLACSDERTRECFDREVVSVDGLERRTSETITDRDKFFEHLSVVAVQGSAVDVEECEIGLCCAAAPVYDGEGQLRAALSISGPGFRLDPDSLISEAVPAVVEAADRLSEMLGRPA